jgi:hypothetical protein
MKSVELKRGIQLFRSLNDNQITTIAAGVFDQLVNLQEL